MVTPRVPLCSLIEALADMAHGLSGKQRAQAFADAGEKYAAALEIKPDMHEALNNWGSALIHQAHDLSGKDREACLEKAEQKVREAARISGKPNYNLACVLALQGRTDSALDALEECERAGRLPSADHMEGDADLEGLRDQPRFAALLGRLRG